MRFEVVEVPIKQPSNGQIDGHTGTFNGGSFDVNYRSEGSEGSDGTLEAVLGSVEVDLKSPFLYYDLFRGAHFQLPLQVCTTGCGAVW